MSKEKKYFWLKLKRDFFKRHDIQIIEAMPNGKDYILFYLKLLCESVDHEGKLRFSERVPYNEQMLATITRTNPDIVRSAITVFTELEMMEMLDDGTLYMNEVNNMLGCTSQDEHTKESTRLRVQRYRDRKKALTDTENRYSNVTCNGEIELEKEIEIDKEIKKVREKAASQIGLTDLYRCTDIRPERINTVYEVMCKVLLLKSDTVKVNSEEHSTKEVQEVYKDLDYTDIEYVCAVLNDPKPNAIGNIEAYIRTLLYNAKSTKDEYWSQKVNHDESV